MIFLAVFQIRCKVSSVARRNADTNRKTKTMTTTTTTISNSFTGYSATIRANGKPAMTTVKRHLRKAKASDCQSVTIIEIDGIRHDFQDFGLGRVELTPF
jgi:hypothetical protein